MTRRGARVFTVVGAALLTIVTVFTVTDAVIGDVALQAGRGLYHYRELGRRPPPAGDGPLVVWLGDSTMVESYPRRLALVLRSFGARSHGMILPGLDPFAYYCMLARVVALKPSVIVVTATTRIMAAPPSGVNPLWADMVSDVSWSEVPALLRLPLAARGLTLPRVLLWRVLRWEGVERAFLRAEGYRSILHAMADRPPPAIPPEDVERSAQLYGEAIARPSVEFDAPLDRQTPAVRMLGAAVELAHRHGVRMLVLASPVPYQRLRTIGHYDETVFRGRMAMLRSVVEGNGGTFVDMHDALKDDLFRDGRGHYTPAGTEEMALRVARVLKPLIAPSPQPAPLAPPLAPR